MDDLDKCNPMVGKNGSRSLATKYNASGSSLLTTEGYKSRRYFPFKQGYLFVATLRVGEEGIQMTVDGKHITSFASREVTFFILSFIYLETIMKNFQVVRF